MYDAIGISKQAVNQQARSQVLFEMQLAELIASAEALRRSHPGCGVEKMYYVLNPSFLGRDRFIEVMMETGFRLQSGRNYRRTTYKGPIVYPNLIKGKKVSSPCAIWQSDITYISIRDKFYYGVFIIDVYSKKIVGYHVSDSLRTVANFKALAMALRSHPAPVIHHSDRGSQYGSLEYIQKLQEAGCEISMGLTAQDNAYAERINRTIKDEYLDHWKASTYLQLTKNMRKAISHYNNKRPHNHLKRLTPVEFENKWKLDPDFIKPTITIFDNTTS